MEIKTTSYNYNYLGTTYIEDFYIKSPQISHGIVDNIIVNSFLLRAVYH